MSHSLRRTLGIMLLGLSFGLGSHPAGALAQRAGSAPAADKPPHAEFAWTLDEAYRELQLNPSDPYLQYIVIQLARQGGKGDRYAREVADDIVRPNRRADISLFSTFTGALAVQESLQLDTMQGETRTPGGDEALVSIDELEAPTIKSHPWKEMLNGREPDVCGLSKYVPADFYYVRFSRLTKLLELMEQGDLWATHLLDQSHQSAQSSNRADRLRTQLCVETNDLLRPFYDLAVAEVAVTGSDLYVREGSDVTLLFHVRQRSLFNERMASFLANAEAASDDVRREEGTYRGVAFVHLTSPRRRVHVYAADPSEELHIRSNSRAALEEIIDVIHGARITGKPVPSLASTDEFKYIRTLMPVGAVEEDGFAYLSDPFIRRQVGPVVKITELRRMQAYNHLRMIGHAQLLHRTQYGRRAASLAELQRHGCAPAEFGTSPGFTPPGGFGDYELTSTSAASTHYGDVDNLRPILEIPVQYITQDEKRQYEDFRLRYDQYWRVFFDPIAIRVQMAPEKYRVETIVLPLIDNSIYTGMAAAFGGDVEPLDALPVPDSNIFSINLRVRDTSFIAQMLGEFDDQLEFDLRAIKREGDRPNARAITERFLNEGIGHQVGFHVCDAAPLFSLSLPMLFREFSLGGGGGMLASSDSLMFAFLFGSLNAPVYVSVPIRDREATDEFLALLEDRLGLYARKPRSAGWFSVEPDFYRIEEPDRPAISCQSIQFGPLKWRMFWTRIDDAVYVASQRSVLDDLFAAHQRDGEQRGDGPLGHAMVRMRADHWKLVLREFELGWAENNRTASLNNISPIYGAARALLSEETLAEATLADLDLADVSRRALSEANSLAGVYYFCPDGGEYLLDGDGRGMSNTLHGTPLRSKQGEAPAEGVGTTQLLSHFRQATATLTFTEEGLQAVLELEREQSTE
jgi:hypothetical protein